MCLREAFWRSERQPSVIGLRDLYCGRFLPILETDTESTNIRGHIFFLGKKKTIHKHDAEQN